jgi:hypothetical protein
MCWCGLIDKISTDPIPDDNPRRIDGRGLPGLDVHAIRRPAWRWRRIISTCAGYPATLLRGYDRDRRTVFGNVRSRRASSVGMIITITGGHGDFRALSELPRTLGTLSRVEQMGAAAVADSPDEVRKRAREQLMQGASQIKLTAGGGVASPFSPLDVVTFTEEELRAAVEAAGNWGDLCLHPRLHAGVHPAFDRWSEMH